MKLAVRQFGNMGPSDQLPDESVVARVLGGEMEAYALLVNRYQEGLFRFAVGLIGNGDAAADVVQDSLVKAYAHLDQCRDPSRFGAWVHRIVRNRCLDYLKAPGRSDLSISEVGGYLTDDTSTDAGIERAELRHALLSALSTLPHAQREAFLMKHLEDRPYEEMADMLGASISALKMRVKRAREALQTSLLRVTESVTDTY